MAEKKEFQRTVLSLLAILDLSKGCVSVGGILAGEGLQKLKLACSEVRNTVIYKRCVGSLQRVIHKEDLDVLSPF